MHLFYAPYITLPHYTLPEEESKHAVRVLRLMQDDILHLTDGKGNLYTTKIVDPNPKHCSVEVIETAVNYGKRSYELTMAVAPTKNTDRYEWFLEKATEIGIDRIVPLECKHSERRNLKLDRGEKVITSAVKQSLKAYHPQLDQMTPVMDFLKTPFDGVKLIAHCDQITAANPKFISDHVEPEGKVLILIGPEGDFSNAEITFALENGFLPISLGRSRLRTETAALVAVMNVAFINQ